MHESRVSGHLHAAFMAAIEGGVHSHRSEAGIWLASGPGGSDGGLLGVWRGIKGVQLHGVVHCPCDNLGAAAAGQEFDPKYVSLVVGFQSQWHSLCVWVLPEQNLHE